MDDVRAIWRHDDHVALPLNAYRAISDGRPVALSGAAGSIGWWCVPGNSPPLFDRPCDVPRFGSSSSRERA
ncbi:hypothetical protein AAGS40_19760 [Paraburkholderia sp. PREW-6R]|uniref:hypothetical protein n=1 Tax=Paraburkholderia sp. PREW-6R TaxID=3141544 RepID=UPI0031F4A35E